jgi:hypothetical protein
MPLYSSARKLAAVIQCVTRTSAECRTRTFYVEHYNGGAMDVCFGSVKEE